jgi:uncharacterized protein YjbI with pentapeptide repeats
MDLAASSKALGTKLAELYRNHGPATWRSVLLGSLGGLIVWAVCQLIEHFALKIIWIPSSLDFSASLAAEQEIMRTAIQIGGGLLVLIGFALTAWRIKVSDKQVKAIEDGQVTERFGRAVEHLGAQRSDGWPNLEVRLGGIFALERIARKSEEDHWTVMEVLCAYVRENAPLKPGAKPEETSGVEEEEQETTGKPSLQPPRVDVQAALTVIGRREKRKEPGQIDLGGARLQQAHLNRAHLPSAEFGRSDLRGAQLQYANLEWASLWEADLRVAILWGAELRGSNLQEANLRAAILKTADLEGANLREADLRRANLKGADLRANLDRANLQGANLRRAILQGADLRAANLQGANLQEADMRGADLWRADLREADLWRADLRGADMRGAKNLTKEQLAEAIIDEETKPPDRLQQYRDKLLDFSKRNLEELEALEDSEADSPPQQPPPQPE